MQRYINSVRDHIIGICDLIRGEEGLSGPDDLRVAVSRALPDISLLSLPSFSFCTAGILSNDLGETGPYRAGGMADDRS